MNKLITWLLLGLFLASFLAGCAPAAAPTPPVVTETGVVKETVPAVKDTVVVPPTVVVPAPTSAPAPAVAVGPVTLKVYDPTGAIEVTQLFAPRLADLNGKTICEVSNTSWEVERTFALVRDLLQKQFPTVKFVTYDQFPQGTSMMTTSTDLGDKLKAKGCQAAIIGNAG